MTEPALPIMCPGTQSGPVRVPATFWGRHECRMRKGEICWTHNICDEKYVPEPEELSCPN